MKPEFRLPLGLMAVVTLVIGGLVWISRTEEQTPAPVAQEEQSKQGLNGPKTVTICVLRDHSFEVALKLLKESDFEERHGIEVEAVLLEFEPMTRAHELDFAKENGIFDLVAVDQPSLGRYVTNEWVRSLDALNADSSLPSLDQEDVVPSLRGPCGEWDGKLYAIPLGSYGALFAYRTDVLSKAGLSPPATFEEFLTFAQQVNAPPDIYGTALFAHVGEYITADAAVFLWTWGAGVINGCDVDLENVPEYRVAWDTPEGIAALEFYASFYRQGLSPPDTLEYDHARYIGAFQKGNVAMGIMPAEGIGPPMEDPAASKVIGKIAYSTLPGRKQPDGSISPPRVGLGAHSLAITRHSKHAREAYLVMQFLTGKEIGSSYIQQGGRPFRTSHFTAEAIAKFPHLKAMRDGMKTGRCRPNIPEYPAVSKVFFTAFHSALVHDASIGEVMRAAAKKANEEILAPAYPDAADASSLRSSDE